MNYASSRKFWSGIKIYSQMAAKAEVNAYEKQASGAIYGDLAIHDLNGIIKNNTAT